MSMTEPTVRAAFNLLEKRKTLLLNLRHLNRGASMTAEITCHGIIRSSDQADSFRIQASTTQLPELKNMIQKYLEHQLEVTNNALKEMGVEV